MQLESSQSKLYAEISLTPVRQKSSGAPKKTWWRPQTSSPEPEWPSEAYHGGTQKKKKMTVFVLHKWHTVHKRRVNLVFTWDLRISKISRSQWNKKWISSAGKHLLHKGHTSSSCVCCTYRSLCLRIWDAPTLNLTRTSLMCLFVTEVKFYIDWHLELSIDIEPVSFVYMLMPLLGVAVN